MKIGIIFVSYNDVNNVEKSLSPWLNAKDKKLDGHEFVISAVSLPFAGYQDMPGFEEDNTTYQMLETLLMHEKIDFLITGPKYIPETQARTLGMQPLLMEDFKRDKDKNFVAIPSCDIIWQVDGDEFYTEKEISKIIKFVEANPLITWFRGSLKNYIFDNKHYLEESFNPARIHRVKSGSFKINVFNEDNDICYKHTESLTVVPQGFFSVLTIPKSIVWTKHLTWLNNETSKKKIAYQNKRWGQCSYKWNEEKNCLEFDENYYSKNNLHIPTVLKD
jgi:hypothetical protein